MPQCTCNALQRTATAKRWDASAKSQWECLSERNPAPYVWFAFAHYISLYDVLMKTVSLSSAKKVMSHPQYFICEKVAFHLLLPCWHLKSQSLVLDVWRMTESCRTRNVWHMQRSFWMCLSLTDISSHRRLHCILYLWKSHVAPAMHNL